LPDELEVVPVGDLEPSHDLDVERRCPKPGEADHDDVGPDLRVVTQDLLEPDEDLAHRGGRRRIDEPDRAGEPDAVAHRVVLDARVREIAVGDAHERAIQRADRRRPEADRLDSADVVAHLHVVAGAERAVERQRDRAEHVLQRLLRGQTDGQAAEPEARDQGGDREAEVREERERAEREDDDLKDSAADLHEAERLAPPERARLLDGRPPRVDDAYEHEEDRDVHQGGRDLAADTRDLFGQRRDPQRDLERDHERGENHRGAHHRDDGVVPADRGLGRHATQDHVREPADEEAGRDRCGERR